MRTENEKTIFYGTFDLELLCENEPKERKPKLFFKNALKATGVKIVANPEDLTFIKYKPNELVFTFETFEQFEFFMILLHNFCDNSKFVRLKAFIKANLVVSYVVSTEEFDEDEDYEEDDELEELTEEDFEDDENEDYEDIQRLLDFIGEDSKISDNIHNIGSRTNSIPIQLITPFYEDCILN